MRSTIVFLFTWMVICSVLWRSCNCVAPIGTLGEENYQDNLGTSGDHFSDIDNPYYHTLLTGANDLPGGEDDNIPDLPTDSPEQDSTDSNHDKEFDSISSATTVVSMTTARASLGGQCTDKDDCSSLEYTLCDNGTCQCITDYYPQGDYCKKVPVLSILPLSKVFNSSACKGLDWTKELCVRWVISTPVPKGVLTVVVSLRSGNMTLDRVIKVENDGVQVVYKGILQGLKEATQYQTSLMAESALWSISSNNTQTYCTAPVAPMKAQCFPIESSVELKLSNNTSLQRVYLSACPAATGTSRLSECSSTVTSKTTAVLNDLTRGTKYTLSLTAEFCGMNSTTTTQDMWTVPEIYEMDVDTEGMDGTTEAYIGWMLVDRSSATRFFLTYADKNLTFPAVKGVYSYNCTVTDLSPGRSYDFIVSAVLETGLTTLKYDFDYEHTADSAPAVIESVEIVNEETFILQLSSNPPMTNGPYDEYEFRVQFCQEDVPKSCQEKSQRVKQNATLRLVIDHLVGFQIFNVSVRCGMLTDELRFNPQKALARVSLQPEIYVDVIDWNSANLTARPLSSKCHQLVPSSQACVVWWFSFNLSANRTLQASVTAEGSSGISQLVESVNMTSHNGEYGMKAEGLEAGIGYKFIVNVTSGSWSTMNKSKLFYTYPTSPGISNQTLADTVSVTLLLTKTSSTKAQENYEIKVCELPSTGCSVQWGNRNFQNLSSSMYQVTDLLPSMSYNLSVRSAILSDSGAILYSLQESSHLIYTAPVMPAEVQFLQQTEDCLDVTWKSTKGTGYELQYGNSPPKLLSPDHCAGLCKVLVDDLEAGREYSFQLFALNGPARSEPRVTYHPMRPRNPTLGTTLNVTETSIQLEWRTENTLVDSFQIEIYEDTINGFMKENVSLPISQKEEIHIYNITGLTAGKTYDFVVWSAVTFKGGVTFGTQDTALKIRNNTRPLAPSGIQIEKLTPSSISLLFTNASAASFYIFEIVPRGENTETKITPYTDTQQRVYVSDLTPGVEYTISIVAELEVWKSDEYTFTVSTNETEPGEPSNFTLSYVNSTSLQVQWSRPSSPNGHLLGYVVSVWQGDVYSQKWSFRNKTVTKQTYFPLHGLVPGVCYSVSVSAQNGAGVGQSTLNITQPTHQIAPSLPQINPSSNNGSHQVEITWSRPSQPNGIIRNYTLTTMDNQRKQLTRICFLCCNCPDTECSMKDKKPSDGDCVQKRVKQNPQCDKTEKFKVTELTMRATVMNLHAYAHYMVNVEVCNDGGCAVKTVEVNTKQDAPSAPIGFSALALSSTSVYVNWTVPTDPNGLIQYYQIFYTADGSKKEESIIMTDSNSTYFLLTQLQKWTKYAIYVRGYTTKLGNKSNVVSCRTREDAPTSKPKIFSVMVINATAVKLQWAPPEESNGVITFYDINYSAIKPEEENSMEVSGKTSQKIIGGLHYWTMYSFSLTAKNSIGSSPSATSHKRTKEYVPTSPVNGVQASSQTGTSIFLEWIAPTSPNGVITNYKISYEFKAHNVGSKQILSLYLNTSSNTLQYNLTGLEFYWLYKITIDVFTAVGQGTLTSVPAHIRTGEGVPNKPEAFQAKPYNSTSMQLSWEQPIFPNGVIIGYLIQYNQSSLELAVTDNSAERSTLIGGLQIWTKYEFIISAKTSVGYGPSVKVSSKTKEAAPFRPDISPSNPIITEARQIMVGDPHTQLAITLPMSFFTNNSYGEPLAWGIIVLEASIKINNGTVLTYKEGIVKCEGCVTWNAYHERGVRKPYRATPNEWTPLPANQSDYIQLRKKRSINEVFVLGKDKKCMDFCNGYLKPGTAYRVKAFVCNRGGCTDTFFSNPITTVPYDEPMNYAAVAGAVIAVGLVLVIIITLVYMKRTKRGPFRKTANDVSGILVLDESSDESSDIELLQRSRQIALIDLGTTVEKLKRSSNLGFAEEYKELKDLSPKHPHIASELEVNRSKNRYTNILPFDHSRVKLLPLDDEEGSDYINANYIPGYNSKREYIASQGPLPGTKDDFWRMIWEQNVTIIVMVTKCMEARGRVKCEQYWPNNDEPVYFGELIVQKRSESILPEYDIRILDIKLGTVEHRVKLFNMKSWPDFGYPETPSILLDFIKAVRKDIIPSMTNPILVHCSAGVGRTGTYIAVDCLLQHLRDHDHDHVDIFGRVLEMREHRTHMVQTEDQYIYIHDCILDAYKNLQHEGEENVAFEDESSIYENISMARSNV